MTTIERLEMKNYNSILKKKQQKYQHYHQVKLINTNFLQVKKYYHLIQAFTNYMHGYNRARNVNVNSITLAQKSVHGIDWELLISPPTQNSIF